MAYSLSNKCAKNLSKRTVLVQLIIKNVVTCFLEHSVVRTYTRHPHRCNFEWPRTTLSDLAEFLAYQTSPWVENHRSLVQIYITSSLESTSRFISSASPLLSRFTSSSTCQPIFVITPDHSHHPSLLHYFTPCSKPTFQQTLPTLNRLLFLPIWLSLWWWDWTRPITLVCLFLVSYLFIFVYSL